MDSFEAFIVYAEEGLYALNRNVPRHEDYVEDVSLRHTGWYSEPRAVSGINLVEVHAWIFSKEGPSVDV